MKNKIQIFMLLVITGCTATNKYKGPNFTFDELKHETNVIPTEYKTSINKKDVTILKSCSEAHSVHSPIIWVPLIGPALDLLLVPSVSELTGYDAWQWFPIIGPPITYTHGTQLCVYKNLEILSTKLEDQISPDVIKEAITISDKNCMNYQHILTAGFNELDANQKFLSDAATMTQTGASFANPVAGAVIGGLKQTVTSANDAIKTSFFVNYAAPQMFKNIATVRKVLIDDLTEGQENNKISKWGYTSDNGMSYANLRRFMTVYDKSCMFEQAISDLSISTDQGQIKLKDPTLTDQNSAKTNKDNDAINSILINNNANAIK